MATQVSLQRFYAPIMGRSTNVTLHRLYVPVIQSRGVAVAMHRLFVPLLPEPTATRRRSFFIN